MAVMIKYSIVIPVYKNEESIFRLLRSLAEINKQLSGNMEAVFVIDGSPDNSYSLLKSKIEEMDFSAQIIAHSRNFGSFPAIRTGLMVAKGQFFSVMAADLQEPPELTLQFFNELTKNECDVVIGTRDTRHDPWISRLTSNLFWWFYRRFVVQDMPKGGVDVFGCNLTFKNHLVGLTESRSSLIALIFWLGFRRHYISYDRQVRQEGKSSWTMKKKVDYMMDSLFSFTDYPIKLLIRTGFIGSVLSFLVGSFIALSRLTGYIHFPGYSAIMVTLLFIFSVNLLSLGVVGAYAWRGYENSKRRPLSIVSMVHEKEKYNEEV